MNNPIICNKKSIIENSGKNTLRWMSEVFGFNYEKPIIMNCFTGNFTINNIWSVIPHNNYDYIVCVLIKENNPYRADHFYAVEIFKNGFEIELNSKTYFENYKTYPDTYFRKGDFEKARKEDNKLVYIIAQRKEHTNSKKRREKYHHENYTFNNNDRYIVNKCYYSTSLGQKCIYRVDITETTNSGKKRFSVRVPEKINFSELFDNSGYYVYSRRLNLKQKAKCLRADREKEKYNNTNYTEHIKTVKSLFENVKKHIASVLLAAQTTTDMAKIDKKISKLRWLVFDIELFVKRIENREYTSNENATKAYNNIMDKLNILFK